MNYDNMLVSHIDHQGCALLRCSLNDVMDSENISLQCPTHTKARPRINLRSKSL
jgi:hypothetical protein